MVRTHESTDTLIIGGGLIGWSVAYHLVRHSQSVMVVDREVQGAATLAGAGIIAPAMSVSASDAFFHLARPAIEFYPELIESLQQNNAGPTGYETAGALFVATNDAELEQLPGIFHQMERLKAWGMGNVGDLAMLNSGEAQSLFPALAEIPGAIYHPDAARVDGRLLRSALQQAAERHGALYRAGEARLSANSDSTITALLDNATIPAQNIVIAGGAWSTAICAAIDVRLPVYPQRGQIIHLELPNEDTGTWPIISGFHTHYILTFAPNRVVCGATREHDSGFDVRMTAAGIHEVLGEGLRVAPGLGDATVSEIRIGLRPFSPDGLPLIGPVPGRENLYICTGHGPSGLQLGPYSGAVISELILGRKPEIDLTPFAPDRFAG